jgi:hypothetical protein
VLAVLEGLADNDWTVTIADADPFIVGLIGEPPRTSALPPFHTSSVTDRVTRRD